MKRSLVIATVLSLLLNGCFTVDETLKVGSVSSPKAATKSYNLRLEGFAATVVDYTTYSGYSTVLVSGFSGPYSHYNTPHFETVRTDMVVPKERVEKRFLEVARTAFENQGYSVNAGTPDYIVSLTFYDTPGRAPIGVNELLTVLSIFTWERETYSLSARLRINEHKSGKLVFSQELFESYSVAVFSPIPIFGITAHEKTKSGYMAMTCLDSLTAQAIGATAEFLAK